MLIKPNEYNGETIIKLSALVKVASDILAVIHDISDDPALLADVKEIESDLTDLTESLKLMEIPNVFKGKTSRANDPQA